MVSSGLFYRRRKTRKYFRNAIIILSVIICWIYVYSAGSYETDVKKIPKTGYENLHKLSPNTEEHTVNELNDTLKFAGNTDIIPYSRKQHGILLKVWPTLDTREVHKRKLNFIPRQYPLEVDFSQLIQALLSGKKVENKAINPHPFKYVHVAAEMCANKKLQLAILVKSKGSNFKMRRAIRRTWGNVTDMDTIVIFLLGDVPGLEANISAESDLYKDIVQEDFIDSYSNNTLKTTMGFNWASRFCPLAKFNLFIDDDVFLNLENVRKYIRRKGRQLGLMAGQLLRFSTPYRDHGTKWFVSWKDYPFDIYPPYLGGFFILTSQDVTWYLSASIPYVKPIPIDDAYIGIVAAKLGITLRSCPGLVRHMPGFASHAAVDINFKSILGFHLISSPESLLATWNLYKNRNKVA